MAYAWEFPTLPQVALYVVLILAAGVANYIATWVIVLGAIFAELRDWVERRCLCIQTRCDKRGRTLCTRTTRFLAGKVMYLVKCPLCVGVWVGFVQAVILPIPFATSLFGTVPVLSSSAAVIVNGLVFKGIGHGLFELVSVWRNRNAQLEAQTRLANEQAKLAGAIAAQLAAGQLAPGDGIALALASRQPLLDQPEPARH